MVPLRWVPCAFWSLQNCKWQLQEEMKANKRLGRTARNYVIPKGLKMVFARSGDLLKEK